MISTAPTDPPRTKAETIADLLARASKLRAQAMFSLDYVAVVFVAEAKRLEAMADQMGDER